MFFTISPPLLVGGDFYSILEAEQATKKAVAHPLLVPLEKVKVNLSNRKLRLSDYVPLRRKASEQSRVRSRAASASIGVQDRKGAILKRK